MTYITLDSLMEIKMGHKYLNKQNELGKEDLCHFPNNLDLPTSGKTVFQKHSPVM